MNNLSPNWPPCVVSIAKLCNGDTARPLKIEIFDFDNDGSHDLMGTVTTSVDGIMNSNGTAWDVEEIKRGKTVKSGQLFVHMPKLEHFPSFVEFINGGMEVSLAVAIDFTASNGDPMDARSLHYVGSGSPNGYQQAIQHVGSIVAEYDSDKMFPVYGFGAKMNGTNVVNHCFPVYGGNGEVAGVAGLQKAYIDALGAIRLSGPTLLSPFLRRCIEAHAPQCTSQSQKYSVLMVLADGCICDMDETIDAIVELSYHPVSIIIVGIGNADFSQMEELDGDNKRLSSKLSRKVAARDIVQFVRLNDYGRTGIANLAKDTLHEIPNQVLGFMKNNKIDPSPPPPPYFA